MKNYISGILTLSLLFSLSCKKKSENPAIQTEEPKDEIIYSEFKSGITIQSVLSYSFNNSACAYTYPLPSDSTTTYNLDVNGDQVADYLLKASHSLYTGSEYCGHCPTYNYLVVISALNSQSSLAAQNTSPGAKIFKESIVIGQENVWVNSIALRLQQCSASWDFSAGYVGVKIGNNFGYIRINPLSTNGIQIQEVGFNKTANRPITSGQK
ncbi:hypothetical protein CNR22_17315 [Sphingobacteriaceae bacterium]|nr:hypothetical protein CNR22_17315 [Sphingobacteriaceae bacterium]